MVFLGHLSLATVALSSFAISSPVGLEKRRTFSVQQQANPNFSGRNGNLAMAKAYRKYGATMPEAEVITAVTSYNGDGEVVATPAQFDSEYISPVSLGGQTLNLVFDTGSADLWVFSTFQSPNSTAGHHVYDNTKSSTFKALNGSVWSIHYGDGSGASGIVGTETVKVGGVTVTKQAVELATSVSASFVRDTNTDGLLGLSFGTINRVKPVQQKTFFDNAKPRLTAPVFTADLKHDAPGTYDFGFIDPAKFEGPIAYLPVNSSRGFWGFTALGHGVGGNSFNSMPVTGIADTGTTLLLLDDSTVNYYYSAVPGATFDPIQQGITFPCATELPSFTISFGYHMAVIPGSLMNFAPINSTDCFGALQSHGTIPFPIYGDILFKSQFVVFDAGNMRLGFANKPYSTRKQV